MRFMASSTRGGTTVTEIDAISGREMIQVRTRTCQCGIDGTCREPSVRCNCDLSIPDQMVDEGKRHYFSFIWDKQLIKNYAIGIVTHKNLLPVTRFNFGRTQLATGLHTLGKFEYSGQVAVVGTPKSSTDLWRICHTFSGFYSVNGRGKSRIRLLRFHENSN